MTHQPPLPPGPTPGPYVVPGQGTPGAPHSYGVQPAYAGYLPPAPRPAGLNPWIAGLIGVLVGGIGAMVLSFVVPMLFFGFLMGGPFGPGFDEELMGGSQRVSVAVDGSVSGVALADALERSEWYEDMSCPDTTEVATDVTTICRGSDGFDDLRVVVVFRGSDGDFSTADVFP